MCMLLTDIYEGSYRIDDSKMMRPLLLVTAGSLYPGFNHVSGQPQFSPLPKMAIDECEYPDPFSCRMIVTSDSIYGLTPETMNEVVMRYDAVYDPRMENEINAWDGGVDVYLKTAYGNGTLEL